MWGGWDDAVGGAGCGGVSRGEGRGEIEGPTVAGLSCLTSMTEEDPCDGVEGQGEDEEIVESEAFAVVDQDGEGGAATRKGKAMASPSAGKQAVNDSFGTASLTARKKARSRRSPSSLASFNCTRSR